MAKSMTGYGRYECDGEHIKIIAEIKSVNHRYCDISMKLPKKFNRFETCLRNIIKQYADRGKIDVFISYEDYSEKSVHVKYNQAVAKGFYNGFSSIADDFDLDNKDIRPIMLARFPEVLTLEETGIDEEEIKPLLEQTVSQAAMLFAESRETEGFHLNNDITEKLNTIKELVEYIETRSPEILQEYRKKLLTKISEFLEDKQIDETILATELIIYADKICVDEETVRLKSHITNMEETLAITKESIGRKMDFIAQEMNREANTILSKANDIPVSNAAIQLKTEIEKIREQIQNIE